MQSLVADPERAGRDLLVSSRTGSGKTLAFGMLVARELLADGKARVARGKQPQALVLAPTRELAIQVQRELEWLFETAGARVLSATGGTNARDEMRRLKAGCEILVATPGRLVDHMKRKTVSLADAKVVVLDEGDEMLRFGFREDLEAILQGAPAERRTHLFSATLPAPILKLASTYQQDAARVSAGAGAGVPRQHEDIEFIAHVYAHAEREAAVVNVLRRHDAPAAIVFTETRAGAAKLGADLSRRGFAAVTLSGEMTQPERTRALASLREGRARVLVATDVAARGLDLPDVALVVHADLPNDASGITHRSGRTGRAGRKGVSVLLCSGKERNVADRMLRTAGVKARWAPLPTAEEIAAADAERLSDELAREAAAAHDARNLAAVDRLLERVPVRELVAALLARARSRLPEPASVRPVAEPPARTARGPGRERERRFERGPREWGATQRAGGEGERGPRRRDAGGARAPEGRGRERAGTAGERAPRGRERGEGMVLFRVNVGERQNADPRWLVPMICRRGGIEGGDIGKIKVSPRSTLFEVSAGAAARFERRATQPDPKEPRVSFMRANSADHDVAGKKPPREREAPAETPEDFDGWKGPRGKPRARPPAGYDEG